jgi:chromate transporter
MSDPSAPVEPPPPKPTLSELLAVFSIISLSGFGGVLYWARRMMVDERRWMTAEAFNECYALCNFLPGPNIVNFSVVFGRQIAGTPGALVALVGLLGPPFVIVTCFGVLYSLFGDLAVLQRMFAGVAAAAAGLTISTAIKMAQPIFERRITPGPVIALAALAAVGLVRWPIYWALAVLIPLSILVHWWWGNR